MSARPKSFKEEHPLGEPASHSGLRHLSASWTHGHSLQSIHLPCSGVVGGADTLLCSAEKRQAEAARIRDKYPDRIPVRNLLQLCRVCLHI